jgi:outer membrane protein OmpA-like peptidoglycan-associated protein
MKDSIMLTAAILCAFIFSVSQTTHASPFPQELEQLYESLKVIEAPIFAPKAYEKAEKKMNKAREAIARGEKRSKIDKYLNESHELAENVFKVTQFAKLTLSDYLTRRQNAIDAKAPTRVRELYKKAEEQFVKATKKVEKGNAKDGLKEAEKAMPLFNEAELKAIKVEVMGTASSLIERADDDDATKFAPVSMDRARTALTHCDNILIKDRYNRKESLEYAATAEYEALHASNITQSIRSMERNDQAWEKLMLLYELEMQKIGHQLDVELLRFDKGPGVAAEEIINNIKNRKNILNLTTEKLAAIAGQLEIESTEKDPVGLAGIIDETLRDALLKRDILVSELDSKNSKLDELADIHDKVAAELHDRVALDERLEKARDLLNPTEGEIVFNATNDIVLRLAALSFPSGSDELSENHVPLLNKVEKILGMFGNARLLVEGHTDDRGERALNLRLSERRAFAVMQYLRRSLSISADRISAIGYGPDKPIGTNTTKAGRAKNRRIDILIFQ